MKANLKKMLALLCCIALVMSLAACGGSGNSSSESSNGAEDSKPESSEDKSAPESSESGDDGDVITLTMFKEGTRPINEKTDAVREFVKNEIGVDMEVIQVAENAEQQLALMISGGEIPDLTLVSYKTYLDYVEQGAFSDISSYISDYSDLYEYASAAWEDVTVDSGIYGVPSMLEVPTNEVTGIRKDWLDKLKLKEPTTLDEWTEVMRAFTFEDPDGNGVDDTHGWCGKDFDCLGPVMGAFGTACDQYYFLNDDDTVTTTAISDNYRNALTYLHGLWEEGIMDPEFFTVNQDQAVQKWCRGEFGMFTIGWSGISNAYLRNGFGDTQPDADVDIIFPPTGAKGDQGGLYFAPISGVVGISHELDEAGIKAALKLLNYICVGKGFYTVMYGVEGVDFETDDSGLINWYWGLNDNKDRNGVETTDMQVYKILYNDPLQRYTDTFNTTVGGKLRVLGSEVQLATPSTKNIFAYTLTDEYLEYNTELEKYYQESAIRFIMGEWDIETKWDSYVSDYLNMGGETVRQSMLEAYNKNRGTSYTFAE